MNSFSTRNFSCASFLLFALGDAALVSTVADGPPVYTFEGARCHELSKQFFADGSVTVGDARALLECSRLIRQTAMAARNSPGHMWIRGDAT
jgi:hypothetical protein